MILCIDIIHDTVCCVYIIPDTVCCVYIIPDTVYCADINECMNRSACPEDSTCIDEEPGYQCRCTKKGFRWDRESNLCIGECGGEVEGSGGGGE